MVSGHEELSDRQARAALFVKFSAIIVKESNARPGQVIALALKTGAPHHMIEAQLPNLWRN